MKGPSPISNRVGMIFVPVKEIERAIAWYSHLLGLPAGASTHNGTIYDLSMQGETGVILDSTNPVVSNSSQPLFFFWTDDIPATYTFLKESGVEVLSQAEDIGSVTTLRFRDPDGNLLMVCQRNR